MNMELIWGMNGQTPTSRQKRYSDTVQHRELRTSSSSSLPSSTSMTPSKQEIDHPTSSSSSSTSPTMTSSTVSSDSVARQERRDLCGIVFYPVTVSSKHVERKEREDLLTKPTKNPKTKWKWESRSRTERLVSFRHTGMAARVQSKPRGW